MEKTNKKILRFYPLISLSMDVLLLESMWRYTLPPLFLTAYECAIVSSEKKKKKKFEGLCYMWLLVHHS